MVNEADRKGTFTPFDTGSSVFSFEFDSTAAASDVFEDGVVSGRPNLPFT